MILRTIFYFLLTATCVLAQYQLEFDKVLCPPHSVPADPLDMYYSVPLNQTISKPIIVYLIHQNRSIITDGPMANGHYLVESLDYVTALRKYFKDDWAASGGKLCQRAIWWEDYPTKYDRSRTKLRCGRYPTATTLTVRAFRGRIVVDWLSHIHSKVPVNKRIFRFRHTVIQISVDSNPIRIFEPAASLFVIGQPPANIRANHNFNVSAEIQDRNGKRLTKGLDSIAFVELTVPFYHKTFYRSSDKDMLLKTTTIRLAGDEVVSHQSTKDLLCRKRAKAGLVHFINVRILDVVGGLKLNLTMTMARDPWLRIPICKHCYDDTKDYNINAAGTEISFRPLLSYKHLPSMTLTNAFSVIEQKLKYLVFSDFTLQSWKKITTNGTISVTRNVIVPVGMFLKAMDDSKKVIYSGKDSGFKIVYRTNPANVCISTDSTRFFSGGKMFIYFSICKRIDNVSIIISPGHKSWINVTTPFFKVVGDINIGHFGDFQYSGDGARIESHINSFMRFATEDINDGKYAKPLTQVYGLNLKVRSFDTQSNIKKAFYLLGHLTDEDVPPAKKIHLIISSATDEITRNLNSELNKIRMPYVSVSNIGDIYKDYPFFSRVCWSETAIMRSFLTAMKQRMWLKLILVRSHDIEIGDNFRDIAAEIGIDVDAEVTIKDYSEKTQYLSGDLRMDAEMAEIKKIGSKIIVLFANGEDQPYILRAAYLSGLASHHGYQWVMLSKYAWHFPFLNPGVCSRGPLPCTAAFRGTVLFSETYNISGYNSKNWIQVLDRFFSTDRYNLYGGRIKSRSPVVGARIALGYDAVLLFARALIEVLRSDKSITGLAIAKYIRKVQIEGLTGTFRLNERGERPGYLGFIAQVWPESDETETTISKVLVPVRLITVIKSTQYEIPYAVKRPTFSFMNGFYKVKSLKYNRRMYLSFSGWLDRVNHTLMRRHGEQWPSVEIKRSEEVVPPYYCLRRCGNNLLNEQNMNVYDTGVCNVDGECVCKTGYAGDTCQIIVCSCRNGICITPHYCQCFPGWSGMNCNIARCTECSSGECIAPDTCRCSSKFWTGRRCNIHLATILAPSLLFLTLMIVFIVFSTRHLIRRMKRNADLSRVDWIVVWDTVTCHNYVHMTNSRSSKASKMSSGHPPIDTYGWKNETWYVKFFNNKTMSLKDEELCLEVVNLTTIRHRNLIVYGGACLTSPDVSLFLEVATKGSLGDLLQNESIELNWDFRYSFIKDICAGMDYLHEKTDLGSHGRLKSSNCLVDGRWTVRISGFGVPTIRFGKYRNESESEQRPGDLLWTPPEFLKVSSCLDDVKNGSKAGDVYSFAMVVSEIVTRAEPYDYELGSIDILSLLDLIRGSNYPVLKEIKRTWEDLGGSDMLTVRPILKKELLPEASSVRIRFKKMLDDAWHDNPLSRPTFDTIEEQLKVIAPVKGELIDNLISLLEAYSNNLELIVVERTEELEVNKARAEELLSQMLPPNVTSELKQGKKILPETFDMATIFFSDIVDFASICQKSNPLQIVALLNETYNMFDEVLDEYDVYKVETISDSYMVVSGVPLENEKRHAGEICTMALDLMSIVTTFQIPHRPKATLQLRIGVNSGPVVAGVVGMLMPRYCLFGDTVNTASRMMTGSRALCIHVSDSTAQILGELGGYELECRGERQVKGRGLMTTYWLWGKVGFNRQLPDQSLALSLSKHKFK